MVPVIGILWDKRAFNPVPSAEEVESIFYAPFEMFLKVHSVFLNILQLLFLVEVAKWTGWARWVMGQNRIEFVLPSITF